MPNLKKINVKIPKELLWSSFLVFSLLFPFLNSFELIVYGTQGKFFLFCFILWILVSSLFFLLPSFYDWSLNVVFSNRTTPFIGLFEFGSKMTSRFPRALGFFYGLSFVVLLAKFEFPDSASIFYISSVLTVLRNILLFPYLGYLALMTWISNDLNSKNLPVETWYNYNFQQFDDKVFSSLPIVNSKKEHYNLQTRRNLSFWVQSMAVLPQMAAMLKATRTVFGTSCAGGAVLVASSSGYGTQQAVEVNLDQADRHVTTVIESAQASAELKTQGVNLMEQTSKLKSDWIATHGHVPLPLMGFRNLYKSSEQKAYVERARQLSHQASEIRTEYMRKVVSQKPEISSVLEFFF